MRLHGRGNLKVEVEGLWLVVTVPGADIKFEIAKALVMEL